jgi:hypothetical protein
MTRGWRRTWSARRPYPGPPGEFGELTATDPPDSLQ